MFWPQLCYKPAEKEPAQPWFSVLLATTSLLQITTRVNANISKRVPHRSGTTCPIIHSVQEMNLDPERPYLCVVQQGLSFIWLPSIIGAIVLESAAGSFYKPCFDEEVKYPHPEKLHQLHQMSPPMWYKGRRECALKGHERLGEHVFLRGQKNPIETHAETTYRDRIGLGGGA